MKQYRNKTTNEIVEASRQHNSIWLVCGKKIQFLETKIFKKLYEEING